MGMRERQILTRIELPLASPVIVGGFRTATLRVIATATIGAILASAGSAGSSSTAPRPAPTTSMLGRGDPRRRARDRRRHPARVPQRLLTPKALRCEAAQLPPEVDLAGAANAARAWLMHEPATFPSGTWHDGSSPQVAASCPVGAAHDLEETQCGSPARWPSGRRCCSCSARARRVGVTARHRLRAHRRRPPAHRQRRRRSPVRGSAADPDRLGQLLRVQARGGDLRPGPRERRLHGRAQPQARVPPGADPDDGARARSTSRPWYVGSGLGFYDKTKTTGDGQENADALQRIVASKGGSRSWRSRPARTRTRSSSARGRHQHEPRRRSATSCRSRMSSSGAFRRTATRTRSAPERSRSTASRTRPKQRTALGRVRRADGPGPQGQGDGRRRVVLDAAGDRPVRVRRPRGRQGHPAAENIAPLVRDDYLAKVPDAAAFQELLDEASAMLTTEDLTALGVKVAVDQQDIDVVAKDWLDREGPGSPGARRPAWPRSVPGPGRRPRVRPPRASIAIRERPQDARRGPERRRRRPRSAAPHDVDDRVIASAGPARDADRRADRDRGELERADVAGPGGDRRREVGARGEQRRLAHRGSMPTAWPRPRTRGRAAPAGAIDSATPWSSSWPAAIARPSRRREDRRDRGAPGDRCGGPLRTGQADVRPARSRSRGSARGDREADEYAEATIPRTDSTRIAIDAIATTRRVDDPLHDDRPEDRRARDAGPVAGEWPSARAPRAAPAGRCSRGSRPGSQAACARNGTSATGRSSSCQRRRAGPDVEHMNADDRDDPRQMGGDDRVPGRGQVHGPDDEEQRDDRDPDPDDRAAEPRRLPIGRCRTRASRRAGAGSFAERRSPERWRR